MSPTDNQDPGTLNKTCAVFGCGATPHWRNTDGSEVCSLHREDPRGFKCTFEYVNGENWCNNDAALYVGARPYCRYHGLKLKAVLKPPIEFGLDPRVKALASDPHIKGAFKGLAEQIQRQHDQETKKKFESGAVCTDIKERYDLICPTGLRRIAARYGLGAKKYSDYNWCKGGKDRAFILARLNHMMAHINKYLLDGNTKDDNLAAIAWNAIALMHFEEDCQHHQAPHLNQPPK